jgi:cell division protein FtsB
MQEVQKENEKLKQENYKLRSENKQLYGEKSLILQEIEKDTSVPQNPEVFFSLLN